MAQSDPGRPPPAHVEHRRGSAEADQIAARAPRKARQTEVGKPMRPGACREMKEKFASGARIYEKGKRSHHVRPAKMLGSSFRKTLKRLLKPITIQGSP